ncbi:glycosyltransferase family 2 protein [Phocaeicola sp.]
MKVSVIIPVYNVEKYIVRCLDSILNQTMQDGVELIIVNDCTPDDSINLIRNRLLDYQGNITVRIEEHNCNKGLAAARNTGLFVAQGKYIIHIDSDDFCELDMLQCMFDEAERTESDIVVSDFFINSCNKDRYILQDINFSNNRECLVKLFNKELRCTNWNKLIKRSLFTNNGLAYKEGINYGEDLLMCIYLFYYARKIAYIHKAFYHYFQDNLYSLVHIVKKSRLQDQISRTYIIEQFFHDNEVGDNVRLAFTLHKLERKLFLLQHTKGACQQQMNLLFPETDNYISRSSISLYWKVALWFATHKMLPVFNLFNWRVRLSNMKRSASSKIIFSEI